MVRRRMLPGAVLVAGIALSGCRVETNGHGCGDDVKVATPFGGLQVKTDASVQAGVGLPVYPGAELVKKGDGGDTGAADLNLSFGRFQLRVKALSYRSGDDSEKVKAFYRKELGRYGDVIECVGHRPVGKVVRTAEGLTCEGSKEDHASAEDDPSQDVELKAGSEHHEHVVGIKREGGGTKFGLVAVDLPEGLPTGDKDSEAKQRALLH